MSRDTSIDPLQQGAVTMPELWSNAYARYFRLWVNLAKSKHLSQEEAEDVVQTVVISAMSEERREFVSLEHIRNYVARGVLNRSLRAYCREVRSTPLTDLADRHHPLTPSAGSAHELKERTRVLCEALSRLPRDHFQIIKLRFYSGLTFVEIQKLLNLPISTLKSRENAALRRISRWLRKNGY
jgi:RNA polymerase sigma factor (sigma-70 family)